MSQGISGNARPTVFNRETVRDQRGEVVREIEFVEHSADPAEADAHWVVLYNVEEPPPEPWVPVRHFSERVVGRPSRCTLPFLGTNVSRDFVQEIEFVAHFVDPSEADVYWVAMCNVEEPPPEPWVPMRPFSERVVGGPSRCTLPFLGTVHSFCHVPENVDFRLPLVGERADEPPEGFFTLYEEHLMRARLWFPIPSVIVEFLDRLEVSISQISPRGIKHLVRLLILGYERGMELTADYLEAFLTLSRVGTDRLLDQASVAVECLPSFRRLWVVGVHNPIPPFPEDLCIVRDLRGGPFTLLPLSRHSIKMEIFHFSRSSQLSSKLPYLSAET
ncbi:hypothetical protein F2Q70_00021788 [Brassica cretica]|uniref:Uncharacterized protein n=1 Tax=Brassica cretica TaxID=69181 RepID=A0A8S9GG07_BRACR|nr:hypothetical protein F2Q70_00021788 [Brassica cretica]